eukprot:m.373898 g.373898  ORF g.373898 m.373898 type:complete len:139 (-) comp56155_c2_seq2:364-780(-)
MHAVVSTNTPRITPSAMAIVSAADMVLVWACAHGGCSCVSSDAQREHQSKPTCLLFLLVPHAHHTHTLCLAGSLPFLCPALDPAPNAEIQLLPLGAGCASLLCAAVFTDSLCAPNCLGVPEVGRARTRRECGVRLCVL